MRIYALPIEQVVTLAQERLTRTWTEEECRQFLHRTSDECREAFGAGE